jgi:hypothetical protein
MLLFTAGFAADADFTIGRRTILAGTDLDETGLVAAALAGAAFIGNAFLPADP